jgi:signal transduction histidine kinase
MKLSSLLRRRPDGVDRPIRALWPLLLLVLSVGASAFAAFQAQAAVRSHRQTAGRLLHDYAVFAAWSFRQHASDELARAVSQIIGPVYQTRHQWIRGMQMHHGDIPPLTHVEALFHDQVERCRCEPGLTPSTLFAFTLGADSIATLGAPLRRGVETFVHDSVTADARNAFDSKEEFRLIIAGRTSTALWFAYTLMPRTSGDTIVYGFIPTPESVHALFQRLLEERSLLPSSLTAGLRNEDIISLMVVHEGMRQVVFTPRQRDLTDAFAADTLPPRFGGLVVGTNLRPELANQLIIGGLPQSRLPILLAMLALSLALAVVAIGQLRKEGELARLRAGFVSSVSHELRTPLAQIRLFVETLRLGRTSTPRQRDWALANIDRETQRLANLVENVLHFSRAPHVLEMDLRTTEVSSQVRHVVDTFAPLAESRENRIELDAPERAYAMLHTESFRRLVLNLLDNAVKYGPSGQTVRVSVLRSAAHVRVTVSDEGPGVPEHDRQAIWTPFFRGASPAARAVGGSGIGLSIVRDIAQRHDGRASVQTNERGGANFVIELPAAPAPASRDEQDPTQRDTG